MGQIDPQHNTDNFRVHLHNIDVLKTEKIFISIFEKFPVQMIKTCQNDPRSRLKTVLCTPGQ